MRKTLLLTTALLCAVLAGGAGPEKKAGQNSAIAGATAALDAARKQCIDQAQSRQIQTYSDAVACDLAAERAFLTALSPPGMDLFESYAAALQEEARETDARRILPAVLNARRARAGAVMARWMQDVTGSSFVLSPLNEAVQLAETRRIMANARCDGTVQADGARRIGCRMAAHRDYVLALAPQRLDIFEAFVARTQQLAQQSAAKEITSEQLSKGVVQAMDDLDIQTMAVWKSGHSS